jgi:tRNA pseudouridine55 synthase
MKEQFDGLLVLDKPGGITSREAVDRALCWFPRKTRIGHTGTLDPLATGVLVLCLGQATRLVEYVQQMNKIYRALFRLGATSDSDDADGTITCSNGSTPTIEVLTTILPRFVGAIEQVPPAYSAAKIAGKRAHALARKGAEVHLQPRTVHLHEINVLRYNYPELEVEVRCGKGTYIRSLARDLGQQLGCGAYVQALRRTRIGPFAVEDAIHLEAPRDEARAGLLPTGLALAELPRLVLSGNEVVRLRRGQLVQLPSAIAEPGEVGVFTESGALIAVAQADVQSGTLRPLKVFA